MKFRTLLLRLILVVLPMASPAAEPGSMPRVDQIVDRHIKARGGAEAWEKIHSMAWAGHIETNASGRAPMPFLMMFSRPERTRYELIGQGQKSIRIFDGTQGWKVKPSNEGIPKVEKYSLAEVEYARGNSSLDGPLFDYKHRGVEVSMQGIGDVEGHKAYGLRLVLPGGQTRIDWIDAETFLELKYDRETRDASGRSGHVSVFYRNYQSVQGLMLPLSIETGPSATDVTSRMVIERVALNPALLDSQFIDPQLPVRRHNGVLIDTTKTPEASH